MSIVYVAIGVVIGTFIPMPQQQIVREYAKHAWHQIVARYNKP